MFNRRTLAQLMAAAALAPAPLSAQGRPPLSRIAFGSCADQAKPQPIWDAILAYQPELFIFAGDNVYGDFNTRRRAPTSSGPTPRRKTSRATTGCASSVAHLAVWDDHDYGINDGGGDFPHKAVAKELFLEVLEGARQRRPAHAAKASTIRTSSARRACACRSSCSTCAGSARRSSHRPARRAGQGTLRARSRSGQDHAGRRAMGLARRRTAQARRAAADRVEHPGPGRRPWLGALGQLAARAPEAFRHDPRQRRQGRRAAVGRSPCRRALSRDAGRPLSALRGDIERPQHGLLGGQGARPQSAGRALCRGQFRRGRHRLAGRKSRWRCATRAAACSARHDRWRTI